MIRSNRTEPARSGRREKKTHCIPHRRSSVVLCGLVEETTLSWSSDAHWSAIINRPSWPDTLTAVRRCVFRSISWCPSDTHGRPRFAVKTPIRAPQPSIHPPWNATPHVIDWPRPLPMRYAIHRQVFDPSQRIIPSDHRCLAMASIQ